MAVWSLTNSLMALAVVVAGIVYLARYRTFTLNGRLLVPATFAFVFCAVSLIAASVDPSNQHSISRVIDHAALACASLAFAWQMLSARVFRSQ
jgi:hypothetical protein